ncbi:serine dehydratase subunit alpha family protein [Proteus sp. G2672]|uniref:L-cysteine desulfidase family protein n=1 Tax=Proteus TaxID=583 RepID=UPI001376BFB3|nr:MULTISPECIES: L-serine ammonia-lyase, iron-sulfur-dependent, subunit alpha [Proteus]MCX2589518.1 L-serine ammonia-lyase, iron-sulfur-dependent, subunit alpha [Proteus penneri]NBL77703.1 serine dehydratase subunit alpha family protein [Proteus sp. G2672]NBM57607.1 serine dehydratase subunit alpha family protein [Proteus sp. G2667]
MSQNKNSHLWSQFVRQLREGVKPAVGCTEPISLALAAAKATALLGEPVVRIEAWVSPNLMKNGMGVTVPGTGMAGLPIAAALGATGGDPDAGLEVLLKASADAVAQAKTLVAQGKVTVGVKAPCEDVLYSEAKVYSQSGYAIVSIAREHTHVVRCECNGSVVFEEDKSALTNNCACTDEKPFTDACAEDIYNFALNVPVSEIEFMLNAARLNGALSEEGLQNTYGLAIGRTLILQQEKGLLGKDLLSEIMIRASAASDARMGGAVLPAMSNSGSGNQGIAATLPVMVVAEFIKADDETLLRALVLSHLMAIYVHSHFPPLSALCAATTASMGAAAGMAWLLTKDFTTVSMSINSMIGDISGIICDGASNSCAMKVSSSAASAYKAVLMAMQNQSVAGTDGIVSDNVDSSIANLCALASRAMQHTDIQIIEIMEEKARRNAGEKKQVVNI